MSGSLPHEPTYSNFHILHGTREEESIYNNFSNPCRRSRWDGELGGCGREISCGGCSILRGKACFLFLILGISFFVTFVLLMVCISSISTFQGQMERQMELMTNLSKMQYHIESLNNETNWDLRKRMNELSNILNENWGLQHHVNKGLRQDFKNGHQVKGAHRGFTELPTTPNAEESIVTRSVAAELPTTSNAEESIVTRSVAAELPTTSNAEESIVTSSVAAGRWSSVNQ
ncbi:uncharacterized protein LOC144507529 isoform X3 [Mustelus asterias]